MNIRKTRSGRFEARMMINGVRYTSTHPTLEDAVNWLKVDAGVNETRSASTIRGALLVMSACNQL